MNLESAQRKADDVMAQAAAEAAARQARLERHAGAWNRLRTAVIALAGSYFGAHFAAPWFGDGVDPWLVGLPVGLLAAVLLPPRRARTPA
ncbi:MAG: hypothetical protein K0M64_05305 [Rhizobium sp.]|nr:hypothetical protein [Rhizobium sp.]